MRRASWGYLDAQAAQREGAVVEQDNECKNGEEGCPGPDAGAGELPCHKCFLEGSDETADREVRTDGGQEDSHASRIAEQLAMAETELKEIWHRELCHVRMEVSAALKPEQLIERYDASTGKEIAALVRQGKKEVLRNDNHLLTLDDLDRAEEKLAECDEELVTDGGVDIDRSRGPLQYQCSKCGNTATSPGSIDHDCTEQVE